MVQEILDAAEQFAATAAHMFVHFGKIALTKSVWFDHVVDVLASCLLFTKSWFPSAAEQRPQGPQAAGPRDMRGSEIQFLLVFQQFLPSVANGGI